MDKKKLIRITTVPQSLLGLLKGQLQFMTANGFEVVGISSGGELLEAVKQQEDVRTFEVKMTRTISPLRDIYSVWKLYRFFKKEKPDIVHTHTPKAGTVGMFAAWLAGVPHRLHTVAGLPLLVAKGKKRRLLDFVEKRTYGWATKVYPNSFGLYDIILQNKYTTSNKLKVLGKGSSNGIDTSYFDPRLITDDHKQQLRASLGIQANDTVYVFVGRMVKDKGINELVAVFDRLNQKHSDTKLVLVGGFERALDPLKPETEAAIHNNASIIGVGHQKDVRPYFAIADVFTFPSYREGFPNVLMQSCAMGIASIATDINGCNEIVEDGVNGYIVPSKDEEKLYEKMLYLYENPSIRSRISAAGRNKMVKDYERLYVQNEILKEYNMLTQ